MTKHYTAEDLDRKARQMARSIDRRATRVSWVIDVYPGGVDLLVNYRADGRTENVAESL